ANPLGGESGDLALIEMEQAAALVVGGKERAELGNDVVGERCGGVADDEARHCLKIAPREGDGRENEGGIGPEGREGSKVAPGGRAVDGEKERFDRAVSRVA